MRVEQRIKHPVNIADVNTAIEEQVQLQSQLDNKPVVNPRMKNQEIFDTLSGTQQFKTFLETVTNSTYAPKQEWWSFRSMIKGLTNELFAHQMMLWQYRLQNGERGQVMNNEAMVEILKVACPGVKVVDYGFGMRALYLDGQTISSPDVSFVTKGETGKFNLGTFAETSVSRYPNAPHYWSGKTKQFQRTRNILNYYFKDISEFTSNLQLQVMAPGNVDQRLKKSKYPPRLVKFTALPYTTDEFDEFFSGIVPVQRPNPIVIPEGIRILP